MATPRTVARGTLTAGEIVTRSTDPQFYSALDVLPNPDPILRRLGQAEEVWDAIAYDAHVMGELRAIRAGLLGYEWRVVASGDDPASLRSYELAQRVMSRRPAPGLRWPDVIWTMAQAVMRGVRVHEVVWARDGDAILPSAILDRPGRRFRFGVDNELRYLTRSDPLHGLEAEAYRFLSTRHMPEQANPYGVAVFSACYWPYVFKHGAWRYFVKLAEKFGVPWVYGEVPPGTSQGEQDKFADALMRMVEDGVGVGQTGGAIKLLERTGGSDPVQQQVILLANRELSKALTSQTLATEIVDTGARAAADTHMAREAQGHTTDRDMVAWTFDELFAWIHEINVGAGNGEPPTFEFYSEAEARADWAGVLDTARAYMPIPVSFAHDRLEIPAPEDGEAVLPAPTTPAPMAQFAAPSGCCGHDHDFAAGDDPLAALVDQAATAIDPAVSDMAGELRSTVIRMADKGRSNDAIVEALATLYPELDHAALESASRDAMAVAYAAGMDDAP